MIRTAFVVTALALAAALPAVAQDAAAPAAPAADAAPAAAAADPAQVASGQRVFNQCRACHVIDNNGRNGVGPNLYGIVDRPAGTVQNFRYSANLRERAAAGLVWNEETLRAYITNPKAVLPTGSMSFPGLRNEQQLNDLIAYLKAQH
jgi:cytochrome c